MLSAFDSKIAALCIGLFVFQYPGSTQSANAETAFVLKRSIAITQPFGEVNRPSDGKPPVAPYYVKWDTVHRKMIQEVKDVGFDAVRLAVEPTAWLSANEP